MFSNPVINLSVFVHPLFQRAVSGTAGLILRVPPWRLVNVLSLVQAGGARRVGLAGQTVVVGAKIGSLAAPRAAVIDRRRRFDQASHSFFFFSCAEVMQDECENDDYLVSLLAGLSPTP